MPDSLKLEVQAVVSWEPNLGHLEEQPLSHLSSSEFPGFLLGALCSLSLVLERLI